MRCPSCSHNSTRVLDSRPIDDSRSIRRRRECENCNFRFTTFEKVEDNPLIVIKKDGTKEEFSKEKILRGLLRACEKRPVSLADIEKAVNEIEATLNNSLQSEVSSNEIGELVMEKLKKIDEVAYVRFASVYRQFKDINTFMTELKTLLENKD